MPPRLRTGDTVGLIAPAMFSDDLAEVEAIKATIATLGLVAKVAPHVTARFGYLAGTDRQRAEDINAIYANKEVRAVIAVHGGWGSARLLPHLANQLCLPAGARVEMDAAAGTIRRVDPVVA